LYGNFRSKDEIAVAAFERAVAIVSAEVRERTKVIEHALDKLKAVVYFYKERILNPPVEGGCPIQNTSVEADDAHPELREKAREAMTIWTDRIAITLQKGIEKGEVRPDVDKAAFAIRFIGTLEGGIMMARLYKDVRYFDVMSRQLIEMIDAIKEG
jgi:AcrR family transcriptional regulator